MADTLSVSGQLARTDLGNATSNTQFTGASSAVAVVQVPINTSTLNRPLRVIAGGRAGTGTAQDFTARLYWGGSSTIASNTLITTAVTSLAASRTQLWMIDVIIGVAETSPTSAGTINLSYIGTAGTVATALTTDDPALPNALLSITGQFASSSASNSAFLDFFEIQSVVGG